MAELVKAKAEPKRRRRLIWYGDGPDVTSGFGTVAREILTRLKARGWEIVSAFGINSLGLPTDELGFPVYSAASPFTQNDHDIYGRVRFLKYMQRCQNFDALLMLQDTFTLSHSMDVEPANGKGKKVREPFVKVATEAAKMRGAKTALYFPIDATPWTDWFQGFEHADLLVTYTDWGIREIEGVCPHLAGKVKRIYHGCDPEFFSERKVPRQQLKSRWLKENDENFTILWVGANQRRKRLDIVFKAFRHFLDHHHKNATLVLRTSVHNPFYVGWDLSRLIALYELKPGQVILEPNELAKEGLRELYQMADAFLYVSMEGWGLPVTEAMSAGCPCVLADHSSLSEIGEKGRAAMLPIERYTVLPSDYEVRRLEPGIEKIAQTLDNIRKAPEAADMMARRAMQWTNENTWDTVVDEWEEALIGMINA